MFIYKVGVVGAGTMGAEIAQVISFAGVPAVLKDVDQSLVDRGIAKARQIYQRRVDKGKMSPEEMEAKMTLISGATTYDSLSDVDLVIEAVPEDLALKQQVFRTLDAACGRHTLLASNTSALSISALGGATKRPSQVIGFHFFYPAHIMKLIEVIPGIETSDDTINDAVGFAESLRKLPIRVNECPGFLVNRLLMPYLNEAAYCLQEGAAGLSEIDQAMVAFGFPMGPFTLVDQLGLDVCHHVANVLLDGYGPRMRPAAIWHAVYERGRAGVKRGAGFYPYGERAEQPDREMEELVRTVRAASTQPTVPFSTTRLLAPMINEAALCLQERIASAGDIDTAVMTGLGFPQEKLGILHYADQLGIDQVLAQLQELTERLGERFWPAPLLKRMVAAGHLGVKTKKGFFTYT